MSTQHFFRYARTLLPSGQDYAGLRRSWRTDVLAGITVGIVALPLALAFGISSGVGAEAGLVTAIVAGIVGAVFGGSPVQVSGPTGAMVVILVPLVAAHGAGAVVVVSVLAGAVLVMGAFARFGRLIGFIPWPVIEGFTAGIGTIIFLQQIPSAMGQPKGHESSAFLAAISAAAEGIRRGTWVQTIAVVAIVVAIMIGLPNLTRLVPSSIVAIVVATIGVSLLGWNIPSIGALPHSFPMPMIPTLGWSSIREYLPAALSVALLAGIESLLSARVAATLSGQPRFEPDRELFGQGLASIVSGAFGGMPATGAIARTAVNVRSGAQSRLAAITHGVLLLAVVYGATSLVANIPLAALAGVLMVTAIRMIPIEAGRLILRSTRADAIVFLATAIITVSFDLIEAVGIGVAATAIVALRNLVTTSGVHREEIPPPARKGDEHIAIFRFEGALFFGATESLMHRLSQLTGVEVVILRMAALGFLDATGAHVLVDASAAMEKRGIHVILKGIRAEHRVLIDRLGLHDSVDVTETLDDALRIARQRTR